MREKCPYNKVWGCSKVAFRVVELDNSECCAQNARPTCASKVHVELLANLNG